MAQRFKYPKTISKLRKEAKDYYKRIYETVAKDKENEEIDVTTICITCIEYSKYLDATDYINEHGLMVDNAKFEKVPNPAVRIQALAMNNITKCWMSLGLTPEARKKLSQGAEPGKAKNKKRAGISVVKG